jgi:hypothetical protein
MSEVSDLSEVVDDGVLGEPYTIQRSTGIFQLGGFVTSSTNIPGFGVVSVSSGQDTQMRPESDRITGTMVFHSTQRIYETQLDASPNYGQGGFGESTQWFSDIIYWNNQGYRILDVRPYPNRNYWRAIGVRLQGN